LARGEANFPCNSGGVDCRADENAVLADFGVRRSDLVEILDAAVEIADADFGNIQLIDPKSGDLRIVAHRGFPQWWVDHWNSEGRGKGRAARRWSASSASSSKTLR
jgi:hypothetical protein